MTKSVVEQFVADPQHMREYQQERAIYEVTELLESVLEEQGISRSQLASILGKSKSWVTQLLDGENNKTVRTLADVFAALGREYCSFQRPIQVGRQSNRQASASSEVDDGANGPVLTIHHPGRFNMTVKTASSDKSPRRAVQ
jgi:transcriptional regulator with XRE-family HTH domain